MTRDTAVVIAHSVLRELPTMIIRLIIFKRRREAQVLNSIEKAMLELTCDDPGSAFSQPIIAATSAKRKMQELPVKMVRLGGETL